MSFAQDLRASVLQAAMQGKLTEQLTTDTPVSELLADIKSEKHLSDKYNVDLKHFSDCSFILLNPENEEQE